MDFSKDIEKQKMGYPSSSYSKTNVLHHDSPSYIMPSYNYPNNNDSYNNLTYSKKYIPLQDQINDNTNDNNSASFGRYITTAMLILVLGMIMFSAVVWLMFGKQKPQFQIVSLQVPTGLLITNTSMLGNWQVNVSMKNPNEGLDVQVDQGKVTISYATNLLAEKNLDPFKLSAHSSAFLFSNLTTSPGTFLDKGTLSEANGTRNDDNNGVLKFALQINMFYEYTSKTESKKERVRVFCNDVKVQFGRGHKDKGELIKDGNTDCIGTTL